MSCRKLRVAVLPVVLCVGAAAQSPALSVCAVLSDPEKYHSQLVRIRGRLVNGPEAQFLAGDECSAQKNSDITGLNRGIWLAAPNSPLAPNSKLVVRQSVQRASAILKSIFETKPPRTRQVFLTVFGELHAKPRVINRTDGKKSHIGYGHLGAQQAQIVVSSIEALEIFGLDDGEY